MVEDPSGTRSLVVRVWLPDRPGALGQVASRIGALRGDVTAIDILERGGGRVVDELVVSLPVDATEQLLAREVGSVDGVAVEHIRPVRHAREDGSTSMLELAAAVAEAGPVGRLEVLCHGLVDALDAEWAMIVSNGEVVQSHGAGCPETGWIMAFLDGSGHLAGDGERTPADVVWARLPATARSFAVGRSSRSFHERERARTATLARILDPLLG